MRPYPIFAAFALLACATCHAQQANVNLDWNPQENTENLTPFSAPLNSPEVHNDRTVTFRVKAPKAETVALNGAILAAFGRNWNDTLPFEKGEDGIWTLTVGPVRPDIYAYLVQVDGVQVADPSNTIASFTGMPPYSQVVVHGDGPAYYDAKNVPHGAITRHIYHSDVTQGERDLYVYTPPGYDSSIQYPVLYLMGGSGELPHNWIHDGRANFILDNLYAEGKAEPMIMVIPNNQVIHRNHPQHRQLSFDILERELREHVIPLIDANYSTIPEPSGRALSGLSMGGRHAMLVGLNSLDLFGSFGILSAGMTDAEEVLADFLNDPMANQKVDYLFIGQGKMEAEGRWNERVQALIDSLKAHDIEYEYSVAGYTAHDWATWRALLHEDFLPNLWRKQ
ncbi:alpha/beta hydrolase-fold protein [Pelagicoccus enzymogenes]|uniref:alpha/beta hydrolase n=1 Tax=Pelagicoccus enzymogenes TaxID=2773457 RepID=UPI0028105C49|nr:alpha/beta hydrolase-fold protein [Pelagicoccus enzymogenes]MDQ8200563.1 alpha/beta hydrolase-fold protein [Pelagicoccus enzymogenes]